MPNKQLNVGLAALAALVLALGACETVKDVVSPPGKSVCKRMGELCGMKPEDMDSCAKEMAQVQLGKERLRQMDGCVEKSQTCAEAAGCVAGSGVNIAVDQAKQFLKGLQRAIGN